MRTFSKKKKLPRLLTLCGAVAVSALLGGCGQSGVPAESFDRSDYYTRGIGSYPGDPGEDFSPSLRPDYSTYRNIALLRSAYNSSSYDYNLTAQLVTDGVISDKQPQYLAPRLHGDPEVPAHDLIVDIALRVRHEFPTLYIFPRELGRLGQIAVLHGGEGPVGEQQAAHQDPADEEGEQAGQKDAVCFGHRAASLETEIQEGIVCPIHQVRSTYHQSRQHQYCAHCLGGPGLQAAVQGGSQGSGGQPSDAENGQIAGEIVAEGGVCQRDAAQSEQ